MWSDLLERIRLGCTLFKRVDYVLNALLIFSLSWIFIYRFLLIHYPERVRWGSELGTIVDNLSIALVASYIFYFIVVHLKDEYQKRKMYNHLSNGVRLIFAFSKKFIEDLAQEQNIDESYDELTDQQLTDICQNIDAQSSAPESVYVPSQNTYRHSNWIEYSYQTKERIEDHIEFLFSYTDFMDVELVELLTEINNSMFLQVIGQKVSSERRHGPEEDLSTYSSPLRKYILLISKLEKYAERELSVYVEDPLLKRETD